MKYLLGIESSCDETVAAIVGQENDKLKIISHVTASSAAMQIKYGGVIPEQAAREQLKAIIPVIDEAFELAKIEPKEIEAIAVTAGPGLIGSLLIGTETAKILAWVWQKPLIGINHLVGHFYANWLETEQPPSFPFIGLLVSGSHSDLVLFTDHGKWQHLGGTRDDAAGECFDKSARLFGLPGVQGGAVISKLAKDGDCQKYHLPRPMSQSKDYDFSFSGLKTAVINLVEQLKTDGQKIEGQVLNDLCASLELAIVDTLVKKTLRAAKEYDAKQIVVAGGVAANQLLRETLHNSFAGQVFVPPANLCTDNAAMIAAAAFYNPQTTIPKELQANPNLHL